MSHTTNDGIYEIDLPFVEPRPVFGEPVTAAGAYWNQRRTVAPALSKIRALMNAVDGHTELTPFQWVQLMSMALEFKPDLIIELGRGDGNSTCVFTEVANMLKPDGCRVVSLCLSEEWYSKTLPKIENLMFPEWFKPLQTVVTDIRDFDYESVLAGAKRVLVFWDAHGYNVADCVLGGILPMIQDREHLAIMHDLSDGRIMPFLNFGENGLWRGNDWSGPRLMLGCINSCVEQAVSIIDFCSRNKVVLHSADQSNHLFFESEPDMRLEMESIFGSEMFQLQAHWYYFSLNEAKGPFTFPKFDPQNKIRDMNDPGYLRRELQKVAQAIGRQSEIISKIATGVFQQAENLLGKGQGQLALDKFREVHYLGRGISMPGLYFSLARAYLKLNRPDDAAEALRIELETSPKNEEAASLLARLENRENPSGAETPRKLDLSDCSVSVPNATKPEKDVMVELILESKTSGEKTKKLVNINDLSLDEIKRRFRDDPWMENYMVNMWEYSHGRIECKTYPWNVTIPVADICNASCQFCNSWFSGRKYLELDELEGYRPVLKYAQYFGLQGHGEPLIHPQFVKMTRMIGDMLDPRCNVYIITNGALLKKYFSEMEQLNITGYAVSLNAATAATHQEIMDLGRNTFDNVVESVRRLVAIRDAGQKAMNISLSMVVTKQNIAEAASFVELANRLGVNLVYLRTLAPAGDLVALPNYHSLPPYLHEDFAKHKEAAIQAIRQSKVPVVAYPDTWDVPIFPADVEKTVRAGQLPLVPRDQVKKNALQTAAKPIGPEERSQMRGRLLQGAEIPADDCRGDNPYNRAPRYYCKFPYSNLNLTDFTYCLYPCCYMNNVPGYEHMNYDGRTDFNEIWNSPAMIKLRQSLKEGPLLSPCRHCPPNK